MDTSVLANSFVPPVVSSDFKLKGGNIVWEGGRVGGRGREGGREGEVEGVWQQIPLHHCPSVADCPHQSHTQDWGHPSCQCGAEQTCMSITSVHTHTHVHTQTCLSITTHIYAISWLKTTWPVPDTCTDTLKWNSSEECVVDGMDWLNYMLHQTTCTCNTAYTCMYINRQVWEQMRIGYVHDKRTMHMYGVVWRETSDWIKVLWPPTYYSAMFKSAHAWIHVCVVYTYIHVHVHTCTRTNMYMYT